MTSNMTLTLKLTIDKKANKVLFGEANKDLVDFLFSIMSLPIGTLISFLSKQDMVGCLGELYGSIEKLNETYIQPNKNKDSILQKIPVQFPLLISDVSTTTAVTGSFCSGYTRGFRNGTRCKGLLGEEVIPSVPKGYVQGVATYLVMDDLAVMPMSTNFFITLLNQFNVQEVSDLEQKVVNFGMKEGLMLLKASLQSKTVLTDLFLVMKKEVSQIVS